jgi:hypothetical protein
MRKASVILFFLGLILEVIAFFGGHADDVPSVVRLLSPTYANLADAKDQIDKGKELVPGNRGFDPAASMFLDVLRAQNPPERVNAVSVRSIRGEGGGTVSAMGKLLAQDTDLKVTLSNGQTLDWKLSDVEARMRELRQGSIFHASVITFIAGLVLQMVGFFLERRDKRAS